MVDLDARGMMLFYGLVLFRVKLLTQCSVAINFVTSEDVRILRDIELYYSMPASLPSFPLLSLASNTAI